MTKELTLSQMRYRVREHIKIYPKNTATIIAKHENIPEEKVTAIINAMRIQNAQNAGMLIQQNQKKEIMSKIDQLFLEKYPYLKLYQQEENLTIYNYKDGVYYPIPDVEVEAMMDKTFIRNGLLDERTSVRKIKDAVGMVKNNLSHLRRKVTTKDVDIKYLNLKNTLLDIKTLKTKKHTPDIFSTVQVPYEYNPNVSIPKHFLAHIEKVSAGNVGTVRMLQQMFGYVLNRGNSKHKVFYLFGDTARNGKSTTVRILVGLIGTKNTSFLSLQDLSSENSSKLPTIEGKQLNFSDEINNKYLSSANLTNMSAEGTITINKKYKPPYSYKVTTHFVIACNDLPQITDGQGMNERMIVIPFDYQFPQKERIDCYEDKLLAEEASGILNWAIIGLKEIIKDNEFYITDESKTEREENIISNNSILRYLLDREIFVVDKDNEYSLSELYGNYDNFNPTGYIKWCKNNGVHHVSSSRFSRELTRLSKDKNAIIKKERRVDGIRYKGVAFIKDDKDF